MRIIEVRSRESNFIMTISWKDMDKIQRMKLFDYCVNNELSVSIDTINKNTTVIKITVRDNEWLIRSINYLNDIYFCSGCNYQISKKQEFGICNNCINGSLNTKTIEDDTI